MQKKLKNQVPGWMDVKSFSLSFSILFVFMILILIIWNKFTGFGVDFVRMYESLHPNGNMSILSENSTDQMLGYIVNLVYASIDGLITGALLAFMNNFFLNLFYKKAQKSTVEPD